MAFGYPEFDEKGQKILTRIGGVNGDMLMDVTVVRLASGDKAR